MRRAGDAHRAPLPTTALAAAAAAGLAILTAAALARPRHGRPHALDRHTRRWFRAPWRDRVPPTAWWAGGRHTRRHAAVEALSGLGGKWATLAAGAAVAAAVARREGPGAALPVAAAVPLGYGAHGALKYLVRRPRPLTARLTGKTTPSFPSGHAARAAAAAGMLGYLAVREQVLPAAATVPLGVGLALAGGAGRVHVDRHWATDAVGGWGLGVAAAAVCALWYERARA